MIDDDGLPVLTRVLRTGRGVPAAPQPEDTGEPTGVDAGALDDVSLSPAVASMALPEAPWSRDVRKEEGAVTESDVSGLFETSRTASTDFFDAGSPDDRAALLDDADTTAVSPASFDDGSAEAVPRSEDRADPAVDGSTEQPNAFATALGPLTAVGDASPSPSVGLALDESSDTPDEQIGIDASSQELGDGGTVDQGGAVVDDADAVAPANDAPDAAVRPPRDRVASPAFELHDADLGHRDADDAALDAIDGASDTAGRPGEFSDDFDQADAALLASDVVDAGDGSRPAVRPALEAAAAPTAIDERPQHPPTPDAPPVGRGPDVVTFDELDVAAFDDASEGSGSEGASGSASEAGERPAAEAHETTRGAPAACDVAAPDDAVMDVAAADVGFYDGVAPRTAPDDSAQNEFATEHPVADLAEAPAVASDFSSAGFGVDADASDGVIHEGAEAHVTASDATLTEVLALEAPASQAVAADIASFEGPAPNVAEAGVPAPDVSTSGVASVVGASDRDAAQVAASGFVRADAGAPDGSAPEVFGATVGSDAPTAESVPPDVSTTAAVVPEPDTPDATGAGVPAGEPVAVVGLVPDGFGAEGAGAQVVARDASTLVDAPEAMAPAAVAPGEVDADHDAPKDSGGDAAVFNVAAPEGTRPNVAASGAVESELSQSEGAEAPDGTAAEGLVSGAPLAAAAADRSGLESVAVDLGILDLAATDLVAADPVAADVVAADVVVADPVAADLVVTDVVVTDVVVTDYVAANPVVADFVATDVVATDVVATDVAEADVSVADVALADAAAADVVVADVAASEASQPEASRSEASRSEASGSEASRSEASRSRSSRSEDPRPDVAGPDHVVSEAVAAQAVALNGYIPDKFEPQVVEQRVAEPELSAWEIEAVDATAPDDETAGRPADVTVFGAHDAFSSQAGPPHTAPPEDALGTAATNDTALLATAPDRTASNPLERVLTNATGPVAGRDDDESSQALYERIRTTVLDDLGTRVDTEFDARIAQVLHAEVEAAVGRLQHTLRAHVADALRDVVARAIDAELVRQRAADPGKRRTD